MSRGKYVAFCDSDDTVSFDYHLPMLTEAETSGVEIVINDWAMHTERAKYYFADDELVRDDVDLLGDEKLHAFFKHSGKYHSYYVLWNKLYKREILIHSIQKLQSLNYPKNTSYAEDVVINFFAWQDAKKIKNIHTGFYFYRIHPLQSVNAVSKEKIQSQIESMSLAFKIMQTNLPLNRYTSEITEKIIAWKALLARTHYSLAKSNGHKELFGKIKESYGIDERILDVTESTESYSKIVLLGENFEQIDSALFSIWKSQSVAKIKFNQADRYTKNCVERLIKSGKAVLSDENPDVIIPKSKASLKLRLIHDPRIYRLGLRLFKKGSKVRKFLKKFLQ